MAWEWLAHRLRVSWHSQTDQAARVDWWPLGQRRRRCCVDLLIASGFWLAAIAVLGLGAKLMHLDEAGKFDSMRQQLGFLIPGYDP